MVAPVLVVARAEDRELILRLGTRKSKLALTQSNWVKQEIEKRFPDVQVELVKVTTKGDKILDVPLAKVGGKGLFVKEIEEALLDGRIDFAVHSLKDVPTELPQGLEVSVFPEREDPRDALIARDGKGLMELPPGAKVGTSSLRRMAQLRAVRPDLVIESLRGNLDTRLNKLDEGHFDAIILAAAGLKRMGLSGRITEIISPEVLLPAIGQGALGIEFRSEDHETRRILSSLSHEETTIRVRAERAFLARLEGGCQVPIGAYATIEGNELTLEGLIGDEDGKKILRMKKMGSVDDPEFIGDELGKEMLDAGGKEILEAVYEGK
ncbi:hydroxymethylbilane synthase [Dissulfuribacter thermophilus]|uniref:hydroxymethylbilane synthase n=1 Tax=Dissulfuribacter thermophilus TaxID=1156395 RepID=UPI001FC923CB|nr:hydroxymethylbilane synthase [Dissulfuribacter thermophilus]